MQAVYCVTVLHKPERGISGKGLGGERLVPIEYAFPTKYSYFWLEFLLSEFKGIFSWISRDISITEWFW